MSQGTALDRKGKLTMLDLITQILIAFATAVAPAPVSAPAPAVTVSAASISAEVPASAPVSAPAPAPAPTVVDLSSDDGTVSPFCRWEDGNGCMWNAAEMGNGLGTSFVAGADGTVAKGDAPVVVTCTTPDGHTYTYGGTAQSAVDLCWQGERRVTLD